MPTLNVWLEIYGQKNIIYLKSQIFLFFSEALRVFLFFKLYQCEIRLQTKIQITQQHNESKLKNTYNQRNSYQGTTSKEDGQKYKLIKHS